MSKQIHGPERLQNQGIGPDQEDVAHRALIALLTEEPVADQVDLVAVWRRGPDHAPREGIYEVWSRRGRIRFQRFTDDTGGVSFETIDIIGSDPLCNQDPAALQDLEAEKKAALASGHASEDPAKRFIRPEHQSYPFAFERVAQLFDSPHAPDLVVSPMDWAFGRQPGSHGALHVRQARAPLWIAGPAIRPGRYDRAVRAVDILPTLLRALNFPLIDGRDASGRTSTERGVAPDVFLRRQDGKPLDEVIEPRSQPARFVHIFLLDGLHPTELQSRILQDPENVPHLKRLYDQSAVFSCGSIVNFPSITWPSHTTLGTGTWCGHHDVVNPSYYVRETGETLSPQGQQVQTESFSSAEVESIYEAFHRVRGADCRTAAIHAPFGRGADHAVLEGRNCCDRERLKAHAQELAQDQNPRWQREGHSDLEQESRLDSRGIAQILELHQDPANPPELIFHELIITDGVGHEYGPHSEGLREALEESDRRIGRVLQCLEDHGRLAETLFVVTADHGMAPQDTSLAAQPARHLLTAGIQAQVADCMVWFRDLHVATERASDGRTGRITVTDADDPMDGSRRPIDQAQIRVIALHSNGIEETIAGGRTQTGGVYGFPTPAEIPSEAIIIQVEAEGFNPRRIHLDGRSPSQDASLILYPNS